MNKHKLKVVWICGFTNTEVQKHLKPSKKVNEIAPWISGLLSVFENTDEIELHIISPHAYISHYKTFKLKNITYHFFNQGIPIGGRNWPSFFPVDLWTDYILIKWRVRKIINKLKPDLIHLHGAENTYHSVSILQFRNKFPVFITVQGIINNSSADTKRIKRRKKRELKIYKTFQHYGIRTKTMGNDVKKFNPTAQLHWHHYKTHTIKPIKTSKKYDLVFFARITKEKGIVDLIKALALVQKEIPTISLCVIGGGEIKPFVELAQELGINKNIHWAGFLTETKDLHYMASQAKISVLPTYHDIISGTILESLFLKLPVVAYNVGSIHEVNEKEDIIALVEKYDVKGLADAITLLLKNPDLIKEKAEKGCNRVHEMFAISNDELKMSLLNIYKTVISDSQNVQNK